MFKEKTLKIISSFLSHIQFQNDVYLGNIKNRCVESSFFLDTLGAVVCVHPPKLGFFHCLDTHYDNRCLEACLACLLFTGRTFQDRDVFLWLSVVLI